jgi:hypothetical protein
MRAVMLVAGLLGESGRGERGCASRQQVAAVQAGHGVSSLITRLWLRERLASAFGTPVPQARPPCRRSCSAS